MNDVPPSQPPPDDIDSFYRRASALDPSRPSDRTRKAVLAHASIAAKRQRRSRWWRPALIGTLAAAGLAGLLVLPQILTPRVPPTSTYATAQHPESGAAAPAAATSTPQAARAPAAEPGVAPLASSPPPAPQASKNAPVRQRDGSDRRQPAPPELDSIAVTSERAAARALESPSPAAPIAPTKSAPAADSISSSEASRQAGSPHALLLAAETGDLEQLQRCLDESTDIDSRDDAGRTALLLATLHDRKEAVAFLLAHGANPNAADAGGVTPLSAAIAGNHSAIIRMLKGAGAR